MTQETQIEPTAPSLAEKLGISESQAIALKNSTFPGAKDESIELAWHYCKSRKLDIMKKPCHIVGMSVKAPNSDKYEWRDVIMPGISEARITAMRTGKYMGQSEAEFGPLVELKIGSKKHQVPEWCKITVYRLENGLKVPYPHIEYFEEAYADKKNGDLNSMWTKRKRGQLSKCAEAGALRKAFPEELGGEIMAEEAQPQGLDVETMKRAEPAKPVTRESINAQRSIDTETYRAKLIEKIDQAWDALGKTDKDFEVACKYYSVDDAEAFDDYPTGKLEELLPVLQKQMNAQAGKTQGQIESEKSQKAAKQEELI